MLSQFFNMLSDLAMALSDISKALSDLSKVLTYLSFISDLPKVQSDPSRCYLSSLHRYLTSGCLHRATIGLRDHPVSVYATDVTQYVTGRLVNKSLSFCGIFFFNGKFICKRQLLPNQLFPRY